MRITAPIPLGIIATGTANVFAREIGLPRSPEQVASTLMNGKVRTIPVGQINGRPFLFVVGIGFDAEAVRQFETQALANSAKQALWDPLSTRSSHIATGPCM